MTTKKEMHTHLCNLLTTLGDRGVTITNEESEELKSSITEYCPRCKSKIYPQDIIYMEKYGACSYCITYNNRINTTQGVTQP